MILEHLILILVSPLLIQGRNGSFFKQALFESSHWYKNIQYVHTFNVGNRVECLALCMTEESFECTMSVLHDLKCHLGRPNITSTVIPDPGVALKPFIDIGWYH